MKSRDLALAALIAGLYGVLTIVQAPMAYGPVQVRLTDALLPTSFHPSIGLAGVIGVTIGNLVANVVSPYGLPDIILGTLANLIVSLIAYWIGMRWKGRLAMMVACLQSAVIVAFIIGCCLLWLIYRVPLEFALPSVLVGELISAGVLGYLVLEGISKRLRR